MAFAVVLIEVCDANPACTPELFALEEAFPGVSVMETSCMSECELCASAPYVFFNGEIISQSTTEALLSVLRDRLKSLLSA